MPEVSVCIDVDEVARGTHPVFRATPRGGVGSQADDSIVTRTYSIDKALVAILS